MSPSEGGTMKLKENDYKGEALKGTAKKVGISRSTL